MNIAYWLQYLPLTMNIVLMIAFLVDFNLGKVLYWTGATILTVGIIIMEG